MNSERFANIYQKLKSVFMEEFPNATQATNGELQGFKVKWTKEEIKDWKGTMDPNYFCVYLAERVNGITLHIWNPKDYYGLEKAKNELSKIGFKVMRGCIQWNRKSEYPVEVMEELVRRIARELR